MKAGEIIRKKRRELGLTQAQLGEKIGVNKSAIARYENGQIENIKRPIVAALSEVLNVSPLDILALPDTQNVQRNRELFNPQDVQAVPVYDPVSCGTGTWVDEEPEEVIFFPKVWAHYGAEYFANPALGDSMEPKINNGDYLIFERTDSLQPGMIQAVSLNDKYFVKWIKQFSDGSYWLISENKDYAPIQIMPDDEFRVLGLLKYRITKEP